MTKNKERKTLAQKTIIAVIILAVVAVITLLVCKLVFNTEYELKTKISQLSSEYYEDYYYPKISKSDKDLSKLLEQYTETGFARVSLRQLILSNSKITSKEKNFLLDRCNQNSTFVQFFPESPYDKTSYRVEYTYSCKF